MLMRKDIVRLLSGRLIIEAVVTCAKAAAWWDLAWLEAGGRVCPISVGGDGRGSDIVPPGPPARELRELPLVRAVVTVKPHKLRRRR
jgi:hypothetical protein